MEPIIAVICILLIAAALVVIISHAKPCEPAPQPTYSFVTEAIQEAIKQDDFVPLSDEEQKARVADLVAPHLQSLLDEQAQITTDWFFIAEITGDFLVIKVPERTFSLNLEALAKQKMIRIKDRGQPVTSDKGGIVWRRNEKPIFVNGVKSGYDEDAYHYDMHRRGLGGYPSAMRKASIEIGELAALSVPPTKVDAVFDDLMKALDY